MQPGRDSTIKRIWPDGDAYERFSLHTGGDARALPSSFVPPLLPGCLETFMVRGSPRVRWRALTDGVLAVGVDMMCACACRRHSPD